MVLLLAIVVAAAGPVVAQAPAGSEVHSLVNEGEAAMDRNDYANAALRFERARQLAPDDLAAARGLVLSYLQLNRLQEAARTGSDALARWPDDAPLQHWVGLVYFKSGDAKAAVAALQRARTLDPKSFETRFDLSLALLALQQYAEAAQELEHAVQLRPGEALPHVLLGRAYQNSNRTVQAIEQFQAALRADPNTPLGHYHLGFAYASLGRNREAIAEYEKELARKPNAEVFYQLGHCQLEVGSWASAISNLKRATEANPSNGDAFYDLGKALLLQGNAADAILALRQAAALVPGDPSPHYQLARALAKTGQAEESRLEMQRFTDLKKSQPQSGGMATGRVQK